MPTIRLAFLALAALALLPAIADAQDRKTIYPHHTLWTKVEVNDFTDDGRRG